MSRKSHAIIAAAVLVTACSALPALAYQIEAPGNYQSQVGQVDWTPAQATVWTQTSTDVWDISFSGLAAPAGHYSYKILNTPDSTIPDWSNSTQVTPVDSWFIPDASGNVSLHLNYTTPASPKWGFAGAWTPQIVGDFQNESGGAGDWNPADPIFNMSLDSGNTWTKTVSVSTPGTYQVKITDGLGWSVRQFGANGYRDNASTFAFTTNTADQPVSFTFDALQGTFVTGGVLPTPPTWNVNAAGEWHEAGNWLVGVPNAAGAEAVFGPVNDWPRTIYNDGGDITIGKLKFNSANTYNIAGTFNMTLESADANPAQINVLQGSHKINLPLTIASDTVITVTDLSTLKISDPVTINNGVSVTQSGTGTVSYESTVTLLPAAALTMASSSHMAALTVGDDAKTTVAQNGSRVLRADALSISTGNGQVDLKDNKLITAQAAGSWDGTGYTGVAGLVKAGRNGGAWNGAGIVTSMPAAASQLTTLAVASAGSVGKTSFAGQAVSAGDTLVMYTYTGDANLSGNIDADDYFAIDSHYNKSANSAKLYVNGDFNYDGQINGDDYMLIDSAFAGQGAAFSSAAGSGLAGVAAVPEPASLGLIVIASAATLRRRSRRA